LHIVVCVKHVPDATDIRFDPITLNLIREGVPSIVNPFCLNAIEEAVSSKRNLEQQSRQYPWDHSKHRRDCVKHWRWESTRL
jgi:hypothetical protein